MSQSGSIAFCSAVVIALMTGTASGKVQIEQDSLHQIIGISSLVNNEAGCGLETFVGRVAKRIFASDALTITGFVVEHADGTRNFINVYIPNSLDQFTQGAVFNGLQRLLKEGRRVTGRAQACGSAPVLTLEQIR